MELSPHIQCPACGSNQLLARYEATYVYSYIIDDDVLGSKNKEEFLPFLFDNREQKDAKQYVECTHCHAHYPCSFSEGNKGIEMTILQKAIRSDHVTRPGFLG